ncbi:MAG: hypothetical protein PF574_05545 [Candidatus Delongbacteria bacterium]|jgi:hypothetical protein|nr:hypothetical protein [Candidatus Delongbacteria bacterium]
MKQLIFFFTFLMALNLFAVYNIGDTVDPDDDLAWTDNFGYSSTVFDEITNQNKVVVLFFGGLG